MTSGVASSALVAIDTTSYDAGGSVAEGALAVPTREQLGGEGFGVVRPGVPTLRHEEGGRAAGASRLGTGDIGSDAPRGPLVVDAPDELLDIELQLACVADEVLELELVLVPEQQVMHLPEFPLAPG